MRKNSSLHRLLYMVVISVLLTAELDAQSPNLDSLEQVLQAKQQTVDEQLQTYHDLSSGYRHQDYIKSHHYAQEGLVLAQKMKNRPMQMKLSRLLGNAYSLLSQHRDSALYFCEQSLQLAQELEDDRYVQFARMSIAAVYLEKGTYSLALEYYLEALAYFEKKESEEDKSYEGILLYTVAKIYFDMRNCEQGLRYLSKAETILRETGNKHHLARAMMLRVQTIELCLDKATLQDKAELEKIADSVRQALKILQEVNARDDEVYAYTLLSGIYGLKGEYADALAYAEKGLQLAEEMESLLLINNFHIVLSGIHFARGNYKGCETEALKVLESDTTRNPFDSEVTRYVIVSNIYMGNVERAATYFDKYTEDVRAYTTKEYQNSLSEMEVKYETEKKELRIAALEKERTLYLWLSLAGGAVVVLVLLTMLLWLRQVKKEKQLIATQSVLDGETAERTRLARDLHDGLGGMLSAVKLNLDDVKKGSFVFGNDVACFDHALTVLNESINELRRVAHNMMPEALILYGLKASLTDFFQSLSNVEFDYLGSNDRFDPKLEVMLYRTAHELVNNALKHAGATHIVVQIIQESARISLTVQDDGCGFDASADTTGMGLKNIRTRVASYNGHIGVWSEPGKGTEINVEFKLK